MGSTSWPLISKTGPILENIYFPGDTGLYKNPIKLKNYLQSEVESYDTE